MNYESAKKLKDSGFVGNQSSGLYYDSLNRLCRITVQDWSNGEKFYTKMDISDGEVYVPTFEELVEWCGEDFASLIQKKGGWEANSRFFVNENGIADAHSWVGATPLEAVANLGIALHKK